MHTSRSGRRRSSGARAGVLVGAATLALTGSLAAAAITTADSAGTAPSPVAALVATVPKLLTATVPDVVASATRLGAIDPTEPLTLIAPLTLDHQRQLDQYVQAEYTPGSPTFHQFLTPSGFASYFGATTAHLNAVTATLRHLGFTVAAPAANHLFVEFSGPASLVEQTFSTVIDRLRLPQTAAALTTAATNAVTQLTTFTANVTDLTIPASLSRLISGLVGLNSLDLPHDNLALPTTAALAKETTLVPTLPTLPETGLDGGSAPCPAAIAGLGYTAPQLAQAYNFNGLYAQGYLGQGMTASLVEFADYHDSNVETVQRCYGDLGTQVQRMNVDGGNGDPAGPAETEDMADIGTMLEMLPQLARLNVYVAPVTATAEYDLYNAFVTSDTSPVLSSSWGNCEENDSQSGARLFNTVAEEAAAQGQQIFEAAGDSGAVDCRGTPPPTGDSISVMTEAASPYVTGVGGTDLGQRTALGLGHDEVTWNDAGAGGGGQSSYWTMPAWQAALPSALHAAGATAAACGAPQGTLCREIPDLSANADPDFGMQTDTKLQFTDDIGSLGYSIYCGTPNCTLLSQIGLPIVGGPLPVTPPTLPTLPEGLGGWYPIGGTSLAAPLTASAALLWDQQAEAHGLSPGLGFINPDLYAVAADPAAYSRDFYDITTDSNDAQYDSSDCPPGCNTKALYPATTAYDMASGLGSYNAANLGTDLVAQAGTLHITPSALTMYGYTKGLWTTQPVVVSSGDAGGHYTATSTAPWLHVQGGTIGSSLTWSVDPTGLAPGTYTGTITVADTSGASTMHVTYEVTPPASMTVSPGALTFSESAVNSNGAPTAASCNSTIWGDELSGAVGGVTLPRTRLAASLQTVGITNSGPAGSVLHWSAFFGSVTSSWISQDIAPATAKVAQEPTQPVVSTQGAQASGSTGALALASLANVNTLGGYSDLNQGTYHGLVLISDLADPRRVVAVPATLILGDGSHSPVVTASPTSVSASVPSGRASTTGLVLHDGAKSCGYAYSASSDVPWAIVDSTRATGTVAPGGGSGTVPVTFDASGMSPGTYHGTITVQSANAEPNPVKVPITLTVT
jgi:kumamolisin